MRPSTVRTWVESYQGAKRTYAKMSDGSVRRMGSPRAERKALGVTGRGYRKWKHEMKSLFGSRPE